VHTQKISAPPKPLADYVEVYADPSEGMFFLSVTGVARAFLFFLAPPAGAGVTIRQSVPKLTQRTWGTAQYTTELLEYLYL
jgi:hypothetical protein